MKKVVDFILKFLIVTDLIVIFGIFGGIEQGEPMLNIFYEIPALIILLILGYFESLTDAEIISEDE